MGQSDDGLDGRVPVVIGSAGDVRRDDAVLIAGDGPAPAAMAVARFPPGLPGHVAGCACCRGRGPVAEALGRLFVARARGEVGFFRRVVAIAPDPAQIREALESDVLVAGRFRVADVRI